MVGFDDKQTGACTAVGTSAPHVIPVPHLSQQHSCQATRLVGLCRNVAQSWHLFFKTVSRDAHPVRVNFYIPQLYHLS
jgi:hypothetical protein